jgi:hypothetical protein
MVDPERDARVSGAYRALARDEPPAALDAAILAASRRRRSRWAVPVSIAAVVVLAVGVTLRVQLEEQKGAEEVALSPQVMPVPAGLEARAQESRRDAPVARAPAAAAPQAALERRAKVAQDAVASPVAPAAVPERRVGEHKLEAPAEAAADRAETAGRASAGVAVGRIAAAPEPPAQWLERIAKLREAGKAREADESLAEFRQRYPDYRIPEAMRTRVAPR